MGKALSAIAAAGATAAYMQPEYIPNVARDMLLGGFPSFPSFGAGSSVTDTESLKRMVEQLSNDLKLHQQRVMVVQTGQGRGSNALTYAVVVGGLGTVAYLTVFRGWRLGDFMYVTRRGLQKGLSEVHARLEGLAQRLNEVKARLQAKLAELSGKQDEAIAAQKELAKRLEEVGSDITSTASQVKQIHGKVYDMDTALVEVGANQRHANQGIYILCKAVGELIQGSSMSAKAELLEFTQHPIWQSDRLQGLEGLLSGKELPGPKSSRPFLLTGRNSSAAPAPSSALQNSLSVGDEEVMAPDFASSSNVPFMSARSLNGVFKNAKLGSAW